MQVTDNTRQKNTIARKSARRSSIPYNGAGKRKAPAPVQGKELSLKERMFVSQYFSNGFNGLKAAVAAGYSERSAKEIASEILTRPHIQSALEVMTSNRLKRLAIDADWILAETVDLYEKAKKSDAYGPAANLLKLLGQEAGVFQEKKEVSHTYRIEALLEDAANDNIIEVNSPPAQ
ncbi:MAG: hypothetical protein CL429_00805 [Acidimicrobiaceae bacterium]|nr:hypothetical protein [Acidimicrobiaceae bacterium]